MPKGGGAFRGACLSALLTLARPDAAGACPVEGTQASIEAVTVRPAKGTPFTVSVTDVAARATIAAKPGPIPVSITGAVSFSGTAADVAYTVERPVVTASGVVRLYPRARLQRARARGDEIVGQLVVGEADDQAGGPVTIDGLRVPCAALSLDVVAGGQTRPDRPRGDGELWRPRGRPRRVIVRVQPSVRAPGVAMVAPRGPVTFEAERIDERGGWMRIAVLAENWVVEGWIERRLLVKTEPVGTTCDCPGSGVTTAVVAAGGAPRYQGLARVAVGTMIAVPEGEGTWARVEKDEGFRVIIFDGADTADVTAIPGVGGLSSYGTVPLGAVTPTPR